jgi:phage tail tape-measure protein
MSTSNVLPSGVKPADPDLAEQAVPGHGVPSQDPNPAAQVRLTPEEAEQESKSILIGGGVVAGLATGAAVGAAVAGPVGILVGATVGAVGGALGSSAVGELVNSESKSSVAKEPTDGKDTKSSGAPR